MATQAELSPCRAPVAWCQLPRMSRAPIVVIVLLVAAARAPACPELPVAPDATNPYELQFGATNVNGALGNGSLTAGFSRCGELTFFKWPGPSYYNQLAYLSDNAADARTLPHLGALDGMGAFPGLYYETASGPGFTWLRDDAWTHAQRYSADDSDVLVTDMTNPALGLAVTAWNFVLPDANVLVNHYVVTRDPTSPVRRATLVFYTNFSPSLARLPFFPIADWGLDFETDYAVVYDAREHALLHFVPASAAAYPHDFSLVNPLLQHPPAGRKVLQHAVDRLVAGLDEPGVYVAAGGTRDEAYGLLRAARARGTSPEAQRAATEAWWASYLAPAHLPDTDDAAVQAFAKRSLIVMRTATDAASGAIVASIDSEPPYGEDWPRDGSFINYALDLAGYPDVVSRHNRFYARMQRKTPAPWSILYSFPPCDPAHPVYPNCVPAGTYETNYYADPAAIVPGDPVSFEIDEAALGVWTMWDHYQHITDAPAAAAYLTDVCPSIGLGADNLAACKDDSNNLQCMANEDDNIPLTQGLQAPGTVLLALRDAVAAGSACGFDAGRVAGWDARASELEQAIHDTFFVASAPAHYEGGRPAWLLWPVGFFASGDPVALSHAEYLKARAIDPVLTRTAPLGAYNTEELLARAQLFRQP